jgi:CDP-diacylglycerol---glycerol-3-phosphate 3-phosphatidyltransferase
MPLNLPNLITWLRIILIPLMVAVFYLPDDWLSYTGKNIAACTIFVVAALSDWLDGYLARALNQASAFGAFLDPVADKLVVAAALIMLLQLGRVAPVVALIIIGREIAISALREWMASIGKSKSVAVAFVGKVKTLSQMIAIPLLLYQGDVLGVLNAHWLGTVLINIAAVLTVISMLVYLRRALPYARG